MSRRFNSNEVLSFHGDEYIRRIKSCFTKDPVASPYFNQLIDYIQSESGNGNRITPVPSAIRIRGLSDLPSQSDGLAVQQWGFDVPEKDIERSETPCLITIEGLPSPGCVAYIGSKYRIRPEYWLGNLSFGRRNLGQSSNFFELPNLPSRRGNIVQVSIPILRRQTGSSLSTHISATERSQAKQKLDEWDRQLSQQRKYGATRIRKLHLHNSEFFSIEQLVSFSVCTKTNDNWIGILLVDQGLAVSETEHTPWSRYTRNSRAPDCIPILMYNESPSTGYAIPSTSRANNPSTPNPFHPNDHLRVNSDEELSLLRKSPFAVLANVLARAASAWAQILNFVDSDIDKCKTLGPAPVAEALGLALEQLRFNFDFLARAQQALNDNVCLIESRGCQTWPGHEEYTEGMLGAKLVSSLLMDHKYLIGRCLDLSHRCETVSQALADEMKVIEARESLDQTKRLNNLTVLAFIFVPVGFVSTFFGMNVDIFADNPPIWTYFAAAGPTVLLVFAVHYLFSKGFIQPFLV